MLKRHPRILFVSFANSPHLQSWVRFFARSEFDVRIFTVPLRVKVEPAPEWLYPTYVTLQPEKQRMQILSKAKWLLPDLPRTRTLFQWAEDRFSLNPFWLRKVILRWKPDIIHSLPLDTGGKLTIKALEGLSKKQWPKWVVSAWGSDIYLGLDDPKKREYLDYIISNCDGFMADCNRDLRLAVENGLASHKLAFTEAIPGTGGLDIAQFEKIRAAQEERNVILIPKAFDRELSNRALPVLEALCVIEKELKGYEIYLLLCSDAVRLWLSKMPVSIQQRCHCFLF